MPSILTSWILDEIPATHLWGIDPFDEQAQIKWQEE
jgi:hypothetical protein